MSMDVFGFTGQADKLDGLITRNLPPIRFPLSFPATPRCEDLIAVVRSLWIAILLVLTAAGRAGLLCGQPTDAVDSPPRTAGPPAPSSVQPAPQADEIARLVADLSAAQFASRERAAARLIEIGQAAVPQLRLAAAESADPEVRLRAGQIVRRLSDGDLALRIQQFLAGEEASFDGWRIFQAILGDNGPTRQLFIDLLRDHDGLLASLELTSRDRALALEQVLASVQDKMFRKGEFPNQADTFAILLPVIDPNVPVGAGYEDAVISVLQKEAATRIKQDAALSQPFLKLLENWAGRTGETNREEVLRVAMQWDLAGAGLMLALETLGNSSPAEQMATALQAIARFGALEHVAVVRPLLEDHRNVAEGGFIEGQEVVTRVSDVAMAAVAVLHGVPLADVGFRKEAEFKLYGFLIPELGFANDKPAARQAVRQKIDALLQPQEPEIR